MKQITKDQFVAVLEEAGINDTQRKKLHNRFEHRHPESHQAFLEYLGLSADEIKAVRTQSRS